MAALDEYELALSAFRSCSGWEADELLTAASGFDSYGEFSTPRGACTASPAGRAAHRAVGFAGDGLGLAVDASRRHSYDANSTGSAGNPCCDSSCSVGGSYCSARQLPAAARRFKNENEERPISSHQPAISERSRQLAAERPDSDATIADRLLEAGRARGERRLAAAAEAERMREEDAGTHTRGAPEMNNTSAELTRAREGDCVDRLYASAASAAERHATQRQHEEQMSRALASNLPLSDVTRRLAAAIPGRDRPVSERLHAEGLHRMERSILARSSGPQASDEAHQPTINRQSKALASRAYARAGADASTPVHERLGARPLQSQLSSMSAPELFSHAPEINPRSERLAMRCHDPSISVENRLLSKLRTHPAPQEPEHKPVVNPASERILTEKGPMLPLEVRLQTPVGRVREATLAGLEPATHTPDLSEGSRKLLASRPRDQRSAVERLLAWGADRPRPVPDPGLADRRYSFGFDAAEARAEEERREGERRKETARAVREAGRRAAAARRGREDARRWEGEARVEAGGVEEPSSTASAGPPEVSSSASHASPPEVFSSSRHAGPPEVFSSASHTTAGAPSPRPSHVISARARAGTPSHTPPPPSHTPLPRAQPPHQFALAAARLRLPSASAAAGSLPPAVAASRLSSASAADPPSAAASRLPAPGTPHLRQAIGTACKAPEPLGPPCSCGKAVPRSPAHSGGTEPLFPSGHVSDTQGEAPRFEPAAAGAACGACRANGGWTGAAEPVPRARYPTPSVATSVPQPTSRLSLPPQASPALSASWCNPAEQPGESAAASSIGPAANLRHVADGRAAGGAPTLRQPTAYPGDAIYAGSAGFLTLSADVAPRTPSPLPPSRRPLPPSRRPPPSSSLDGSPAAPFPDNTAVAATDIAATVPRSPERLRDQVAIWAAQFEAERESSLAVPARSGNGVLNGPSQDTEAEKEAGAKRHARSILGARSPLACAAMEAGLSGAGNNCAGLAASDGGDGPRVLPGSVRTEDELMQGAKSFAVQRVEVLAMQGYASERTEVEVVQRAEVCAVNRMEGEAEDVQRAGVCAVRGVEVEDGAEEEAYVVHGEETEMEGEAEACAVQVVEVGTEAHGEAGATSEVEAGRAADAYAGCGRTEADLAQQQSSHSGAIQYSRPTTEEPNAGLVGSAGQSSAGIDADLTASRVADANAPDGAAAEARPDNSDFRSSSPAAELLSAGIDKELTTERTDLLRLRAELQEARIEAAGARQTATAAQEAAAAAKHAATATREEANAARQENAVAQVESESARREAAMSREGEERALAEVVSLSARLQAATEEVSQLRADSKQRDEAASAEVSQLRQERDVLRARVAAGATELDDLRQELDVARAKAIAGAAAVDRLKDELDASRARTGVGPAEIDQLRQKLDISKAKNVAGAAEVDPLKEEIDASRVKVGAGPAEIDQLRQELDVSRAKVVAGAAEIDRLKEELDVAQSEVRRATARARRAAEATEEAEIQFEAGLREKGRELARLLSQRDEAVNAAAEARRDAAAMRAAAGAAQAGAVEAGRRAEEAVVSSREGGTSKMRLQNGVREANSGAEADYSRGMDALNPESLGARGLSSATGSGGQRGDFLGDAAAAARGCGRWEREMVAAQAEMARLSRELQRTQEEQLGASLRARRKERELQQLRAARTGCGRA